MDSHTSLSYLNMGVNSDMANPNASYKGPSKNKSSFISGVKAAQKRKKRRDDLDKLRAQEALRNKNKKRKRK